MDVKLFSTGYEEGEDVVLPGKIQATVNSVSLKELCVCDVDNIRMCSLDFVTHGIYYMCESKVDDHCSKISHRIRIPTKEDQFSLEEGQEDARIVDSTHISSVFTRIIDTKIKLRFSLKLPKYCRAYYYKSYKIAGRTSSCVMIVADKGAKLLDGSFSSFERRMLVLMAGAVTYDKENSEFCFGIGHGAVAFIDADYQRYLSVAEKAFFYIWTADEKYLPLEKSALSALEARKNNGAIFSCFDDRRVYMEDLVDAVRAFLTLDDIESAKNAISAINTLSKNGECFYPVYPYAHDKSDSVSAVYFIYAVMKYHNKTNDNKFVLSLYKTLKNAMTTAAQGIKDGMLAQISTSDTYKIGILSEGSRYHGSAVSTAMCIDSFDWLYKYFTKIAKKLEKTSQNLKSMTDNMVNSFESNFIHNEMLYHTSQKREEAVRRTRFSYGRCVGCADHGLVVYEGMLERTSRGAYLCPRCFEEFYDKYSYVKEKRIFSTLALSQVVRSCVMRKRIGEERLAQMLWNSFGAYNGSLDLRTTREDAYMLECAVILDKEKQAKSVYSVLINNADKLGRYTRFCDKDGRIGNDFHSGSCAAVICALERYREYISQKKNYDEV